MATASTPTVGKNSSSVDDITTWLENHLGENKSSYVDDIKFDIWALYLKPTAGEWLLIFLYLIVFVMSLIGNCLIVLYIARKNFLQTTVNYFILNLAIADILVTLICLPPTMLVDFFETWLFGSFLCKLTPYLQMTVTCVSTLSLSAIAINRWFVVCHPLRALEIKNSKRAAFAGMGLIWGFSLITQCPVVFATELLQTFNITNYPELEIMRSCVELWKSTTDETVFHCFYIIFCYTFPLFVLAATYTKIFQALNKAKIPGNFARTNTARGLCSCNFKRKIGVSNSSPSTNVTSLSICPGQEKKEMESSRDNLEENLLKNNFARKDDHDLCYDTQTTNRDPWKKNILSSRLTKTTCDRECSKCSAHASLLQSRRRCAFMQVTLIVVFCVCYAPAMILNFLRRVLHHDFGSQSMHIVFAVAHLLLYVNSAINPVIYNFFSGQFRKEFKKTFRSCWKDSPRAIQTKNTSFRNQPTMTTFGTSKSQFKRRFESSLVKESPQL